MLADHDQMLKSQVILSGVMTWIGELRKVELLALPFLLGGCSKSVSFWERGFYPKGVILFQNSSNTFNIDGFCNQTLLIGKNGEFITPLLLLLF